MRDRNYAKMSGLILLFLLASVMWQTDATARGARGGFDGAIFDVVPDGPGLAVLPATGGTFFITGKVYAFKTVNQADCSGITNGTPVLGIWRAWGEAAEDGKLVIHQSLQLDAYNGSIELQGPSGLLLAKGAALPASTTGVLTFTGPTEVLSVTGGVGTYRSVAGEAQIRPYCQTQSDISRPFRYDRAFCFSLVETPRRN